MISVTGVIFDESFECTCSLYDEGGALIDWILNYLKAKNMVSELSDGRRVVQLMKNVCVYAEYDDHEYIARVIEGIPHYNLGTSGTWYGDHAKFIIANLER